MIQRYCEEFIYLWHYFCSHKTLRSDLIHEHVCVRVALLEDTPVLKNY